MSGQKLMKRVDLCMKYPIVFFSMKKYNWLVFVVFLLFLGGQSGNSINAQTIHKVVNVPGKQISPDLFGVFFEDINYAADGGLYAELIQNRSFEYSPSDKGGWNPFTSWEFVTDGYGIGTISVETTAPIHPNNPHYVTLNVEKGGTGVGLRNSGYDGIALKAGEYYNFSIYARQVSGLRFGCYLRIVKRMEKIYGYFKIRFNSLRCQPYGCNEESRDIKP